MKIIINNSSMTPIYEQVVEQIKAMILSEELEEGDILPSVRSLSKELKISALTVKKAYALFAGAEKRTDQCADRAKWCW